MSRRETKERHDYRSRPTRDHAVIEIYLLVNIFVNVILEIKKRLSISHAFRVVIFCHRYFSIVTFRYSNVYTSKYFDGNNETFFN